VNRTELTVLDGPLWTVLVIAMLLSAIAVGVYRLWSNRQR
jgi:hypothetical protein